MSPFLLLKACKRFLTTAVLLLAVAGTLDAAPVTVTSNQIALYADDANGGFGAGTSPFHPTLPLRSYTFYHPPSIGTFPSNTTTAMVNGSALDFAAAPVISPMTSGGSGAGAFIQTVRSLGAGVELTARYEIALNPMTGTQADSIQLSYTFANTGGLPVTVGLRVMVDTRVNGNDGANVSVDNGISIHPTNTVYRASGGGVPSEWWAYDVPPPGPTTLVSHGSVASNPFGVPATPPDVLEVAHWNDVLAPAQWTLAPAANPIGDSTVVIWWTGTGDESNGNIVIAPGATQTFTTYYGFNQIPLAVPPTPTPTVTPTPCGFPVATCTPTATPANEFYVSHNAFSPALGPVSIYVAYPHSPGDYGLAVYNTAGEQIVKLDERRVTSTSLVDQSYLWDGKNHAGEECASGVYLIVLTLPLERKYRRVLLIR